MTPAYFGEPNEQLLGLHHPPRGGRDRGHGVLLCGPSPQEALQTHWMLRRLANALSREGFHAFRFDYFGTGDSAGDDRAGSLERWRKDIFSAAKELRELTGVRTLSAVGLRLGGYLAAEAAAEGLSLQSLVLWEPPLTGAEYLEALERSQQARFNLLRVPPRAGPEELLGFPLTPDMRSQIRALQLSALAPSLAGRVSVFTSAESPAHARVCIALSRDGRTVGYRSVPEEGANVGRKDAALTGSRVLTEMVSFLGGGEA